MARAFAQHLPDAGRVQVDVEVGRDLAALGDVEERQADEEWLHLGVRREGWDWDPCVSSPKMEITVKYLN